MSKTPILIDVKFDASRKKDSFEAGFDGRPLINLNDGDEPDDYGSIKYALVWKPAKSLMEKLTGLEILFSAGAGVDHIFQNGAVPDVPIVRFVDHTLTTRMSEWVCLQCLMHLRQSLKYLEQQKRAEWNELPQPQAGEIRVGIMGMGVLGQDCARKLSMLGFQVNGWSRTKKNIQGIGNFGGDKLDAFLGKTDFLVGLLPLTEETAGIFNRGLFEKLARNNELASPVFINAGRGGSQVEADIVACLEDGTLGGVCLDVFQNEPLPASSPLWNAENAVLTPHAAAVSDIAALGRHVENQLQRFEAGMPLQYLVDRSRGY